MTYLLTVDVKQMTVGINAYEPDRIVEANRDYAAAEEQERENLNRKSVLASVEKIEDLKKAFPNYWADTVEFLNNLRQALYDPN